MATNETYVGTSHNLPNYSGLLFNKGNTRTPFSTLIGGKRKVANAWKFPTSVVFNPLAGTDAGGLGAAEQPAITESASLTAPNGGVITRSQNSNYIQIFQKTVALSYGKTSSMGQLSGLNLANAVANPSNELDFQVAGVMQKMGADIEYTFINGVGQDGNYDDVAYKTSGILGAITTNVVDGAGKSAGYWLLVSLMEEMASNQADMNGIVLMANATHILQLNADAKDNGLTVVPGERNVNGIKLDTIITPFGSIGLIMNNYVPAGTVLVFNPMYCSPVDLPVPGKGNFFLEELAKTGAADKYQIYGQLGLDYGAEWMHGKITGLATTFTAPESGTKIYAGSPIPTVEVDAQLTGATLDKSTVEASDTAKVGVASLQYNIKPGTDPSLTYLWQVRAKTGTTWTDLTNSYTGYNTSELTVKAADAEKHYRCKVTASGSANGTVYSGECDVEAAE